MEEKDLAYSSRQATFLPNRLPYLPLNFFFKSILKYQNLVQKAISAQFAGKRNSLSKVLKSTAARKNSRTDHLEILTPIFGQEKTSHVYGGFKFRKKTYFLMLY